MRERPKEGPKRGRALEGKGSEEWLRCLGLLVPEQRRRRGGLMAATRQLLVAAAVPSWRLQLRTGAEGQR